MDKSLEEEQAPCFWRDLLSYHDAGQDLHCSFVGSFSQVKEQQEIRTRLQTLSCDRFELFNVFAVKIECSSFIHAKLEREPVKRGKLSFFEPFPESSILVLRMLGYIC